MSQGESATPLGKVRGLGSAHHGGHHWLEERFTSVALVLLSLWLIFSLIMLPGARIAAPLERMARLGLGRDPDGAVRRHRLQAWARRAEGRRSTIMSMTTATASDSISC